MSQVSEASYGVGKAIISILREAFANDPNQAAGYYAEGATLYYEGQPVQGRDNIRSFLEKRGQVTINITGWEVQSCPQVVPDVDFTMVVAFGTIHNLASGSFSSFHSACYVSHKTIHDRAVISYHTFSCF